MDPDSYTKRMTVEYDGELLLEIEGTSFLPSDRTRLLQIYWQLHPRVVFFHGLAPNARVLDVGAGNGGMVHARQVYFPDRSDMHMYQGCSTLYTTERIG
jgi:hypothetical protein